jgi:hypothetical protein
MEFWLWKTLPAYSDGKLFSGFLKTYGNSTMDELTKSDLWEGVQMPDDKKLKMCPRKKCGKESPEEAEFCIGCGLDFALFKNLSLAWEGLEDSRQPEKPPDKKRKPSLIESLRGAAGGKK